MAPQVEFIAFGMTAEIVVIVENEDAAVCLSCAVEVRGGEAADASTDDDQVVFLAGIPRRGPALAVAQGMGVLEGAGVTAPEAGEERRVVAEGVLSGGGQRDRAWPGFRGGVR